MVDGCGRHAFTPISFTNTPHHIPVPSPHAAAEQLRSYLRQLRETLAPRLVERVYAPGGPGAKFWLAFGKRRFMGRELPVA